MPPRKELLFQRVLIRAWTCFMHVLKEGGREMGQARLLAPTHLLPVLWGKTG